jgi:hypothetical protein
MKPIISDPVVLICSGIVLVGFFGLIWAIAKFRSSPKANTPVKRPFDDLLSPKPDLGGLDLGGPLMRSAPVSATVPTAAPTPLVSKEVAERLDGMTQRLAKMQSLLSKQASAPSDSPAHPGSMGQGFSPETIDKLLKIIGNVIQQVDILQKNLNPAKEGIGPKVENPSTPAPKL